MDSVVVQDLVSWLTVVKIQIDGHSKLFSLNLVRKTFRMTKRFKNQIKREAEEILFKALTKVNSLH